MTVCISCFSIYFFPRLGKPLKARKSQVIKKTKVANILSPKILCVFFWITSWTLGWMSGGGEGEVLEQYEQCTRAEQQG
jgi:hypothetical protein